MALRAAPRCATTPTLDLPGSLWVNTLSARHRRLIAMTQGPV